MPEISSRTSSTLGAQFGLEKASFCPSPHSSPRRFAMPVMMVLLYGYALNMDIKNIPIGIVDHDHGTDAQALIRDFTASINHTL